GSSSLDSRLRRSLVRLECGGEGGRGRVSFVEDDPVTELDRLAGREDILARDLLAKVVPPERIGGEQAIIADVPGGRIAEARRVVEDGHPDGLAIDRPRVIHPERRLAPGC